MSDKKKHMVSVQITKIYEIIAHPDDVILIAEERVQDDCEILYNSEKDYQVLDTYELTDEEKAEYS